MILAFSLELHGGGRGVAQSLGPDIRGWPQCQPQSLASEQSAGHPQNPRPQRHSPRCRVTKTGAQIGPPTLRSSPSSLLSRPYTIALL